MLLSRNAFDNLIMIGIYIFVAGLTLWGGGKLIDYALEHRFYNDFLLQWKIAMQDYTAKGGKFPRFTGANHVAYMEALIGFMKLQGVNPPESNTGRAYVYRLKKSFGSAENVFVLCMNARIVIYGMSPATFVRLDKWVDGRYDPQSGALIGALDAKTRIFSAGWSL